MKYTIGEVSKILNIPTETLRYYDREKIVTPDKNEKNNYRMYEPWDINFLTDYIRYRSFDFSMQEIEEIMYHDNLEQYIEKMDQKQQTFENKLKYYQYLVEKQQKLRNDLKSIKANIGEYKVDTNPEIHYFLHRFNDKYLQKDEFNGIFENWLAYLSFVEPVIELKKIDLESRTNNNFAWGFSLEKQYIDAFSIPLNEQVKTLKQQKCIKTIIVAGQKGSFSLRLLDGALKFIAEAGYQLVGDPLGVLIARVHELEGYCRYIQVWLPIK